jgi:hypothetical protein
MKNSFLLMLSYGKFTISRGPNKMVYNPRINVLFLAFAKARAFFKDFRVGWGIGKK